MFLFDRRFATVRPVDTSLAPDSDYSLVVFRLDDDDDEEDDEEDEDDLDDLDGIDRDAENEDDDDDDSDEESEEEWQVRESGTDL